MLLSCVPHRFVRRFAVACAGSTSSAGRDTLGPPHPHSHHSELDSHERKCVIKRSVKGGTRDRQEKGSLRHALASGFRSYVARAAM
jgi:hypothetical protein